jgi:type IV pilus assembly protein PilC
LFTTPRQLAQTAEFYHQLSQVTSAGLGLLEGLAIHLRATSNPTFRRALPQLIGQLESGATFGDALEYLRAFFPTFDIALLRAGELSGRLPECLLLLSHYYEERAQLLRQVWGELL